MVCNGLLSRIILTVHCEGAVVSGDVIIEL